MAFFKKINFNYLNLKEIFYKNSCAFAYLNIFRVRKA